MHAITIRINVIVLDAASQDAVHELRLAAAHAAQSKLHVCRALAELPANPSHVRRLLESFATALQIAIESPQRLAVSR